MRAYIVIFILFISVTNFANQADKLVVEKDGFVIEVKYFEDGDKLKLFEVATGDHILSKTHAQIDLSFLPVGLYLLENTNGQSILINRKEEELIVDGLIAQNEEFLLEHDCKRATVSGDVDVAQEFVNYHRNSQSNLLAIEREGDLITVVDFEEGDKIKLFEMKNTVHVLSKTSNLVDLSQLPSGVYVLENDKGDSVVIEKFARIQSTVVSDM